MQSRRGKQLLRIFSACGGYNCAQFQTASDVLRLNQGDPDDNDNSYEMKLEGHLFFSYFQDVPESKN